MNKVKIKRNTDGDTRVATKVPTFQEFYEANRLHTQDVKRMMKGFAEELEERASYHDWSKRIEPHESTFYRELCNTIEGRINFEEGEWYKFHCENERHHLLNCCPDDVNLVDVIEMLCDCVCAGMARIGYVRDLEINTEILERAVGNTAKMLEDIVELEDF